MNSKNVSLVLMILMMFCFCINFLNNNIIGLVFCGIAFVLNWLEYEKEE